MDWIEWLLHYCCIIVPQTDPEDASETSHENIWQLSRLMKRRESWSQFTHLNVVWINKTFSIYHFYYFMTFTKLLWLNYINSSFSLRFHVTVLWHSGQKLYLLISCSWAQCLHTLHIQAWYSWMGWPVAMHMGNFPSLLKEEKDHETSLLKSHNSTEIFKGGWRTVFTEIKTVAKAWS